MVDQEIKCKTHPDAPHGFDRNASHCEDRYVCECESWEPPADGWVSLTDEDILQAIRRNKNKMYRDFAKDIEAVLKEKNGW